MAGHNLFLVNFKRTIQYLLRKYDFVDRNIPFLNFSKAHAWRILSWLGLRTSQSSDEFSKVQLLLRPRAFRLDRSEIGRFLSGTMRGVGGWGGVG